MLIYPTFWEDLPRAQDRLRGTMITFFQLYISKITLGCLLLDLETRNAKGCLKKNVVDQGDESLKHNESTYPSVLPQCTYHSHFSNGRKRFVRMMWGKK